MSDKILKILHGPTNVGGHASTLVEEEKKLGFNSRLITLYDNYLKYGVDECRHLEQKNYFGKIYGHLKAVYDIRQDYDVYHFNYGSTYLHFLNRGILGWDLPFYDKEAKFIFTFNGCDARQKYKTMARNSLENTPAACFRDDCYNGMCNSGQMDKNRAAMIEKISNKAHHIFALNPDLLYFLPKEKSSFLPYIIQNTQNINERTRPFFANDCVRVLHAPTQRGAKGTDLILKALASIKDKLGAKVEIKLIENMPHKQALAEYQNADLVIDQALIGWYGGLAVEVMQMGIPVACYINEAHKQFVPKDMAKTLPLLKIHPLTLEQDILKLLSEREVLQNAGKVAREWVNIWHNPLKTARHVAGFY